MVDYTPAEQCMRRLIMARGLLNNLKCIRLDGGIPPQFVSYYGTLHLVQFMDAYEALMGCLTEDQKKPVTCLSDLISGIVEHRGALREVRNKWIAHLQDDGGFAEDAPDFVRRAGLPDGPMWYIETFECAVIFADAVQSLLPDVAESVREKVGRVLGAAPPKYPFDQEEVDQNIRTRLGMARKKAAKEYPDCPWASLLGILGPGPEKLGGSAS